MILFISGEIALDAQAAGILKRYARYNGTEGNSKTPEQSMTDFGVEPFGCHFTS